jgi:hypothetical protein
VRITQQCRKRKRVFCAGGKPKHVPRGSQRE